MSTNETFHLPSIVEVFIWGDAYEGFYVNVGGDDRARLGTRREAIEEAHTIRRGLCMAGIASSLEDWTS